MNKIEPKHRRQLNNEQLAVINLLFEFRFGVSEQFASYFGKQSGKAVQKRLRILAEQEYISKRYGSSYKLKGRPAEYYLLPKGARLLQAQQGDSTTITDQAIKNLYKDKTVSEQFIAHSVSIFSVYLKLRQLYGDKLGFFTKTKLNLEKYDYFVKPLPDAYIFLKRGAKGSGKTKRFFLDIFEDDVPFFVLIRRLKRYLQYAEEEDAWGDNFPTVLMVCESARRQKQLQRRIAKELRESYEDEVVFYTTTKEILVASSPENDNMWKAAIDPSLVQSLRHI